jgi:hypothetical protein
MGEWLELEIRLTEPLTDSQAAEAERLRGQAQKLRDRAFDFLADNWAQTQSNPRPAEVRGIIEQAAGEEGTFDQPDTIIRSIDHLLRPATGRIAKGTTADELKAEPLNRVKFGSASFFYRSGLLRLEGVEGPLHCDTRAGRPSVVHLRLMRGSWGLIFVYPANGVRRAFGTEAVRNVAAD